MNSTIKSTPGCADPFDPDSISVATALEQIDAQISPLASFEELPIRDCLGRINFEAVQSPIDVPAHANSAMDGFAISVQSLTTGSITAFKEIGTALAGAPFAKVCGPLECVRIMTGAVIPAGVDAVIMQEQAQEMDDASIRIDANHKEGENIRFAGEDVKQDQVVLRRGVSISPADLGVLASLGIATLKVFHKPTIAFFSTGDELTSIGSPLRKGQIYDSNRYTLYGMLASLPVTMMDLGVIPDNPDAIRRALLDGSSKADLIITTGGVSVGQADYIKSVLSEIGNINFWKILIKPGRPLTFGKINNCLIMGLPGNPVAVMVTFSQFVKPAIQKLSGAIKSVTPLFKACALDNMRKRAGRYEYLRGIASIDQNNQWLVKKTGKQGSGILTSMSRANCFIVLPEANSGVAVGDQVDIQLFDWAAGGILEHD